MQPDQSALLEPIAADSPCGEDLEDTQLLASFDAFRLFGQSTPLAEDTDWRAIRDHSLEALAKSRDLRLLAHLGAAVVRTGGLESFAGVLEAAAKWLETWWDEVFPRVDEDAILRRNALNGFGDRMAIVDGVRRAPLLTHRQLGSLCIRDIEIATGQIARPEDEPDTPDESQVNAMFAAGAGEEVARLQSLLQRCVDALNAIETLMRERADSQAVPDFTALAPCLARTLTLVNSHAGAPGSQAPEEGGEGDAPAAAAGFTTGAIRSRDDAVRALDAVAAFFRASEPSSPVPLFIDRAKRLVAKDFLSVLADIAPDALDQARSAGGVRDEDE